MFFIGFSLALGALIISYKLFLPSMLLAKRLGAIDIPDKRRSHSRPTPRLGGFSFFIAFFLSLLLLPIESGFKIALLVGSSVIFLVGILDDSVSISPFAKLTGQFLAGSTYIMIAHTTPEDAKAKLFGVASLFWAVFLSNSINLCDGLDGLASGISISQAVCLCAISTVADHRDVFLCSLMLIFAILGFLPQNLPPAKIFMGDCGSLFLGFTLSVLSSRLVYDTQSLPILLAMPLIFRIPTADTVQSFFRRILKGKNPFSADRGHFHHKLVDLGFSKDCAALALICASLLFGLIGVIIVCVYY